MLDPRTPLWPTRIGFRLIAAVLAMVMLVQVVPATAFARPKITPLNPSEIPLWLRTICLKVKATRRKRLRHNRETTERRVNAACSRQQGARRYAAPGGRT